MNPLSMLSVMVLVYCLGADPIRESSRRVCVKRLARVRTPGEGRE